MSHHKLTYVAGTQVCVDQHFLTLPSARCCDAVTGFLVTDGVNAAGHCRPRHVGTHVCEASGSGRF